MKTGDLVRHTEFDMVGVIIEPTDSLIGKMALVDWFGWKSAWCGKQWVEAI